MATTGKWLEDRNDGEITIHNSRVAMTMTQVNSMAQLMLIPPITHIFFGDYSKWCSSLIYYPIWVEKTKTGSEHYLNVGLTDTSAKCYVFNPLCDNCFTLGQYYYESHYEDFRDYEPYTLLELYLPYYGFIPLKIADVIDKHIQFLLKVDFMTGQAMYIIAVSSDYITYSNAPYTYTSEIADCRIISKHSFQLGANIPLGQTGMAETIRNITLSLVKSAGNVIMSDISADVPVSSTTTNRERIKTTRNKKTGRQITKEKLEDTTIKESFKVANPSAEAFDGSIDVLNAMSLRPGIDRGVGVFLDSTTCRSIKIIKRRAKVKGIDNRYRHTYGVPLGEMRPLSLMHGYTEISQIHLEGSGFNTATDKEMSMLYDAITSGVIFSDPE